MSAGRALLFSAVLGLALGLLVLGNRVLDLGLSLTMLRLGVGGLLLVLVLLLAARLAPAAALKLRHAAGRLAPWLPVLGGAVAAAIGIVAFQDFPSSADEWGYVFGAETLASGRLTALPTPDPVLFRQVYVLEAEGIRVSQYLPGWPALLALPMLAGLSLVLASAAALLAMLLLLRRALGTDATGTALLLAAGATAMVVLNGATLFNHVATTAAALTAILALRAGRPAGDAVAGAAWSAVALMRLDVALPLALVLGCAGGFGLRWRRALAMGAGALPGLLVLLAYNAAVTGNPLTPPTMWGGNLAISTDGVAAVEAEYAGMSDLTRVTQQTLWRLVELSDTWPLLPALLWLALLPRRVLGGRLACHDAMLPATLLLFAVFPDFGGFQIGPRYWFTGLIVALVAVAEELRRLPAQRAWLTTALLLGIPAQAGLLAANTVYLAGLFAERRAVFDLATALDGPALVMVPTHGSAWDRRFNLTNAHRADDFMRNPPLLGRPVLFVQANRAGACRAATGRAVYRFVPAASGGPRLDLTVCD